MDEQIQTSTASTADEALEFAPPGADLAALDRLVGEWTVSGGVEGVVRYEWLPGRHFLVQHIDFEHFGERITGIEMIGRLHPFGQPASADIISRFYDSVGRTFDYVYELTDDVLTIWAGERGSRSFFRGEFSDDDRVLDGSWVYEGGGGYDSMMTRR